MAMRRGGRKVARALADAGLTHALNQNVRFRPEADIRERRISQGLNGLLVVDQRQHPAKANNTIGLANVPCKARSEQREIVRRHKKAANRLARLAGFQPLAIFEIKLADVRVMTPRYPMIGTYAGSEPRSIGHSRWVERDLDLGDNKLLNFLACHKCPTCRHDAGGSGGRYRPQADLAELNRQGIVSTNLDARQVPRCAQMIVTDGFALNRIPRLPAINCEPSICTAPNLDT